MINTSQLSVCLAVIFSFLLVSCEQTGTESSQSSSNSTDIVSDIAEKGLSGTWDVRWEGLGLVHQKPVSMHGYLVVDETTDGIKATFNDEKLQVSLNGDQIEFSYIEALRSETTTRIGQLTITFRGKISRDSLTGTISRSDGIMNARNLSMAGAMITPDDNAAPGFLPITLLQMGFLAIRFNNLSDQFTATRVDLNDSIDISGIWMPRPEMANEWLQDFEELLTEEAIKRRSDWVPYDDPALRCSSAGLMRISSWPMPFDVVQSDRMIAFVYEGEGASRRIHMDGRAIPEDWLPSGMGYSVGKWTGTTLEITSKLLTANQIGGRGIEHRGDETVVTEKITMTADGKFLRIETTLTDPLTFSKPLRRISVWEKNMEEELVPYECDGYTFFRGLHMDGKDKKYFSKFPKY